MTFEWVQEPDGTISYKGNLCVSDLHDLRISSEQMREMLGPWRTAADALEGLARVWRTRQNIMDWNAAPRLGDHT